MPDNYTYHKPTNKTKKALLLAYAKDIGLIEDATPGFTDLNKLEEHLRLILQLEF